MQRDRWDYLFEEPAAGDVENVVTRPYGGYHAVSIEQEAGFMRHHDIVVTRPWKPSGARSGHVVTLRTCMRCAKPYKARRGETCSAACRKAMWQNRVNGKD